MEVILVGIIGWAENNLEIINCANLNTISGLSNSAGGIIGMCENVIGGIYNSYNIGEICTNGAGTGGVVGSANSDIEIINVYNQGDIIENGAWGRSGILGSNYTGVGSGNVYINNAYNLGNVIENNVNWTYGAGAICGYPSNTSILTIEKSYYKKGTCSVAVGNRKDNLYGVTVLDEINYEDIMKNFNKYIDENTSKTFEWKSWGIGEAGYPTFLDT